MAGSVIQVLLVVATAGVGLWLLFWFLGSNYFGRGKKRSDFGHGVRSLLLLMEKGGILRIDHKDSEVQFDVVRATDSDESADLVLSVPRADWSEAVQADLERVFDSHEFDATFSNTEERLCEVQIHVPDIWDEACGARAARAAHLLLETLSIDGDARFDFSLLGPRSNRIARRSRQQRTTR